MSSSDISKKLQFLQQILGFGWQIRDQPYQDSFIQLCRTHIVQYHCGYYTYTGSTIEGTMRVPWCYCNIWDPRSLSRRIWLFRTFISYENLSYLENDIVRLLSHFKGNKSHIVISKNINIVFTFKWNPSRHCVLPRLVLMQLSFRVDCFFKVFLYRVYIVSIHLCAICSHNGMP